MKQQDADSKLITALGWEPCWQFQGEGPCMEHGYAPWSEHGQVCKYQRNRLANVRIGIYLARKGIADALRREQRGWYGVCPPFSLVIKIAEGWGNDVDAD